jgi:RNase H-like domain found in reverse transcriptase
MRDSITHWLVLTSIKELWRFLAFCDFPRRYIPRFGELTAGLTGLLKKNAHMLALSATLYQIGKRRVPNCFADVALLNFWDHKDVELITFYSHILTSAEANYSAIELEFFRVVKALELLKSLLLGTKLHILVLVDHCKPEQLIKYKPTKGRYMKWLDIVTGLKIKIAYLPGSENVVADALSRSPGVGKLKLN